MAVMKFAVGLAAGYVLGTRAGREKYEQIVATARKLSSNSGTPTAGVTSSPTTSVDSTPTTSVDTEPLVAESSDVAGSPVPRPPRRRTKSTLTTPSVTADPLA